jgi:hypothetical protein
MLKLITALLALLGDGQKFRICSLRGSLLMTSWRTENPRKLADVDIQARPTMTRVPTSTPTNIPTRIPTSRPTTAPTRPPSYLPTSYPAATPTTAPTYVSTPNPTFTYTPSLDPSAAPSYNPTQAPTCLPTTAPTCFPTAAPTCLPTTAPTCFPTAAPTWLPTPTPSQTPSAAPTWIPSAVPTSSATAGSATPTRVPTTVPTVAPPSSSMPTSLSGSSNLPAQILDLSMWYLQLPISATGEDDSPEFITTSELQTYVSPYLYVSPTRGVVFYTPVIGVHTSGSENPRTELRETFSDGSHHDWLTTYAVSTLTASLAVNAVPVVKTGSTKYAYVVIGQIKGSGSLGSTSLPLAILQYRFTPSTSTGKVLAQVWSDVTVSSSTSYVIATGILLNQTITYGMTVAKDPTGGGPTLLISVNGASLSPAINVNWASNTVYFKAGCYSGDNSSYATGFGQVTFYSLSVGHLSY